MTVFNQLAVGATLFATGFGLYLAKYSFAWKPWSVWILIGAGLLLMLLGLYVVWA